MSVLGDRIIEGGPFSLAIQCGLSRTATAEEWNELRAELVEARDWKFMAAEVERARQELIDLRARAGAAVASGEARHYTPVAGGLRPCPICEHALIGPDLVECTLCAASEDAAAKRRADQ